MPERVKPSREELIALLYREFGAFLAHSPHNPERFWGQPADAVLALLPGKTEQEVRADMLDALIDRYLHGSRAGKATPWGEMEGGGGVRGRLLC